MAISKTKKEEIVNDLKELFNNSNIAIFADFSGMDVTTITNLRSQIRDVNGRFVVAKKSLIQLALKDSKADSLDVKAMEGEIAIAFSRDGEATSIAKTVHTFAKEKEQPSIVAAIMDDGVLSRSEVVVLATLPSREELLTRLVGSINAPTTSFVRVLNGNISSFVRVLNGIAESKK